MIKKNAYKKGFSMAELLLALLVISIVLSASMPTVIRGAKADREQIWRWTGANTSAYFGKNSNQRVLIGAGEIPSYDFVTTPEDEVPELNAKVSVFKSNNKSVSHIDILTEGAGESKQAARIFADESNIALGIDVLKYNSIVPDIEPGLRNTGIGNGVLSSKKDEDGPEKQDFNGNDNTGIGHESLARNISGNFNTAIGSGAGEFVFGGNNNTLIGYGTGASSGAQKKNTIIGTNACSGLDDNADRNICIGYNASGSLDFGDVNSNRLIIGSDNRVDDENYYPLITGFLGDNGANFPKGIDFNVRNLKINTFDGEAVPFLFQSGKGTAAKYQGFDFYTSETYMKYYQKTGGDSSYTGVKTYVKDDKDEIKLDISAFNSSDASVSINSDKLKLNLNKLEEDTTDFELTNSSNIILATSTNDCMKSTAIRLELQSEGGLSIDLNESPRGSRTVLNSESGFKIASENAKLMFNGYDLSFSDNERTELIVPDDRSILIESKLEIAPLDVSSGYTFIFDGDKGLFNVGNNSNDLLSIQDGNIKSDNIYFLSQDSISVRERFQNLVNSLDSRAGSIPSDIRLKNIKGDFKAGLKEIDRIKVKNFTYKNDEKQEPHVGVIAQDLQKIFPRSVFKEPKTGYLNIKTEEIFFASINAVKELYSKFLDLTAKVTGLDEKLLSLQKENAELKAKSEEFERRLDNLEADD